MKKWTLPLLCCLLLIACQRDPSSDWQPLDLLPYGLPVTILAPDSAVVKASDRIVYQDITIQGPEKDYYVQIFSSTAETNDIARLKADQVEQVKTNRYFSRIVSEEKDGFLYETMIDSSNINYGFRYVRVQGDYEMIFQTGLVGSFTLEQAQRMYEAVQPQAAR